MRTTDTLLSSFSPTIHAVASFAVSHRGKPWEYHTDGHCSKDSGRFRIGVTLAMCTCPRVWIFEVPLEWPGSPLELAIESGGWLDAMSIQVGIIRPITLVLLTQPIHEVLARTLVGWWERPSYRTLLSPSQVDFGIRNQLTLLEFILALDSEPGV